MRYGYHMVMARTQTLVQLTDELVASLDVEARRRRLSRSALIREVLEAHLAAETEAEIDRNIIEGYTRIPPPLPDPAEQALAATIIDRTPW